jgi:YD repeat-containing protein
MARKVPARSRRSTTTRWVARQPRDGNGNVTGYTYDSHGDVTSELHADGGVVRYTYDAIGDKTSMVDANGATTLYAYDHVGHLIQQEQTTGVQV